MAVLQLGKTSASLQDLDLKTFDSEQGCVIVTSIIN